MSAASPPDMLLTRLAEHRVFQRLDRATLLQLSSRATVCKLAPRRSLFLAGDSGNAVFVVLEGWLKLNRTCANGRDIVLELAGPGNVFGELVVVTGAKRSVDAIAISAASLASMPGDQVLTALKRNPEALLELTRIVCERLAAVDTQLEDNLSVSGEVRLARALIRLVALNAMPDKSGLVIDLGLSQKDLGDITGLSREATNKQLAMWRDGGLVRLEGRSVVLANHRALQQIADLGCVDGLVG